MEDLLLSPSAPTLLILMEISTLASSAVKTRSAALERGRTIFCQSLGPLQRTQCGKEKKMNDQNRVLARKGARDLNEHEIERVAGGLRTATKCSVTPAGALDGDTFHSECGSPDQ